MKKGNCEKIKRDSKLKKVKIYFNTLIIVFITIFFVGCMAKYVKHYQPENIRTTTPEINTETTCFLGEALITSGIGHYASGIMITSDIIQGALTKLYINKGFYEKIPADDSYEYYYPTESGQIIYRNGYGAVIAENTYQIRISPDKTVAVIDKTGFLMPGNFTAKLLYKEVGQKFIEMENSFQQTLIYLGKENNIVNFNLGFAYEAVARAHYLLGNKEEAEKNIEL